MHPKLPALLAHDSFFAELLNFALEVFLTYFRWQSICYGLLHQDSRTPFIAASNLYLLVLVDG